jgi:single-strand DNA-binding protein
VYVEGSLRTSSYDDKTTGQKRYKTEIIAQRVQFLGGGGGTRLAPQSEMAPADDMSMGGMSGGQSSSDDDIPF